MTFVGQDLENRATTKNSQEYPPGPAHNRRKLCYITHSSLFQAFRDRGGKWVACVQTSPISFVARGTTKEIGDVCTQASKWGAN